MSQETQQRNADRVSFLLLLISKAEAGSKQFSGEITLFTEGLNQKCGHNKLEALGIPWREALTAPQHDALGASKEVAADFARFLHGRLITHLSPDEIEVQTLNTDHIRKCSTALRMGVQGLIRWRASLADHASIFMPDTTVVTDGLCPVIRAAADDYFAAKGAMPQTAGV